MIECAMCRRSYDPDKSGSACAGCTLLTQGCGHSRCPFCGYENQRPLKDAALKWGDLFQRLRGVKR